MSRKKQEEFIAELPKHYEILKPRRPGTNVFCFSVSDGNRFVIIFDKNKFTPHDKSGYGMVSFVGKENQELTALILPFNKRLDNEPPIYMKDYEEHLRVGLREKRGKNEFPKSYRH